MDVSNHAYRRAKERLSWSKSTLDRMSERAFTLGVVPSETKSRLKTYIRDKMYTYVGVEHLRIYGEYIYFYAHDTLITVYKLPRDLVGLLPKG